LLHALRAGAGKCPGAGNCLSANSDRQQEPSVRYNLRSGHHGGGNYTAKHGNVNIVVTQAETVDEEQPMDL